MPVAVLGCFVFLEGKVVLFGVAALFFAKTLRVYRVVRHTLLRVCSNYCRLLAPLKVFLFWHVAVVLDDLALEGCLVQLVSELVHTYFRVVGEARDRH